MKQPIIDLIKDELLCKDFTFPVLTTCKVSRTYINKDLVHFINRLLNTTDDKSERQLMLIRLKKTILQTPREPDQTQLEAEPAEFAQFFNEIKKEQDFFEPIRWIDAELDFMNNIKTIGVNDTKSNYEPLQTKELLNRHEVLELFKFSKTTLNRRIAEGMPAIKIGAKVMFNRQKVIDWLNNLP